MNLRSHKELMTWNKDTGLFSDGVHILKEDAWTLCGSLCFERVVRLLHMVDIVTTHAARSARVALPAS
jgi:hypothetical protein